MRIRVAVFGALTAAAAMGLVRDVSAQGDASREEIADLVDELRDPDAHVREVARKQIVALGEKAVAPLVALLKSGEPRGRAEAVAVLAAIGPAAREAAPVIADGAKAAIGSARLPFVRALAEIDPVGSATMAVPILLAFLDDRDPAVRLEAARALRLFGPSAASFAPDVLAEISSADAPVRSALLEAVRAMGVDAAQRVVDLYIERGEMDRAWLSSLIAELGESVVPPALARLSSGDKAVRAAAAQALGAAGAAAGGATPQLVAALKDPAGVVRRRAAEALGMIGADPKIALPALAAVLSDVASRAQIEAATALARVAVPPGSAPEDLPFNSPEIDRAVEGGLDWLARHQGPSGAWSCAGFPTQCDADSPCGGVGQTPYDVGVTGLAALAFLGAGETTQKGPHKTQLKDGLKSLRDAQDFDGCFGPRTSQHFMYNHAVATLAVAEAYRLTGGSHIFKEPAQRGVSFVLKAKNPYLAWRYGFPPDGENDTSVTGWMVMALHSAALGNLDFEKSAFRDALAWVEKMTEPEFGRTGYQQRGGPPARTNEAMQRFPPNKSESLTAEALVIRLDAGHDPKSDPWIRKSSELLVKCPPRRDPGAVDFYYWRFGAEAMHRIGGAGWDSWRASLASALLPMRTTAGCARGSWAPEDPWGAEGGRVYSTAMALLALEECRPADRVRKVRTATPEVRIAIEALTKAGESDDEAVRQAAKTALDAVRAVYVDAPK